MKRSVFLRTFALGSAAGALSLALTGCSSQELRDFFSGEKSSSGSEPLEFVPDSDERINAKMDELYALEAQANADLDAIIASARDEYTALPSEKRTNMKKIAIVYSRVDDLTALQSYYDGEVARVVAEMRDILRAEGRSEEPADRAQAIYEQEKAAIIDKLRAHAGI